MDEKEKEVQELEEAEQVTVEEGEKETDTQEVQEVADNALVFLSEADVSALIPTHLPDETKTRILERQYPDDVEARRVIGIEVNYLKSVTGSGKPFTAGGDSAKVALVNVTELAKEAAERQSAVNARFLGG